MTVLSGSLARAPRIHGARDESFIDYTAGLWRVRLRRPRLVFQGASAADHGWFTSLLRIPATGAIVCRVNRYFDVPGQPDAGTHMISLDGGWTWGDRTEVSGACSTGEPIAVPVGSGFGDVASGCAYSHYIIDPQDARALLADRLVITNSGKTLTVETRGVRFSGLLHNAILDSSNPTFADGQSFGDIVQVSTTRWLGILAVKQDFGPIAGIHTNSYCIESVDQGRNWTVVGEIVPNPGAWGGVVEGSLLMLAGGTQLMFVSRIGSTARFIRSFSNDFGRTWSTVDRTGGATGIAPGTKSPRLIQLANTGDIAILAGQGGPPPPPNLQAGDGLYLTDSPTSQTFQCVDLCAHHNAMMPSDQRFDLSGGFNWVYTSGYMGGLQLSPGQLLITYDRVPNEYGGPAEPPRVYAVEAFVIRA